jgi:two-component system alkaline phosphatase synthesis response regulator PhoP
MNNNDIKILIVDDEIDILEFLGYNLKKEGFQVYTANNGKESLRKADELKPNIILLDVMMPEMDGIETCIELRKRDHLSNTIISFLTARSEDYSQVAGLEAGADDYIAKPIKPKVLVSKINSFVRRLSKSAENEVGAENLTVLKDVIIDKERYIVIVEGKEIVLPKKEFEILAVIASKPNKVFRRDEIFARVWGNDVIVGDRTIDVHVRKIREKTKLENIKTVKGVGYKYEEL